MNNFANVLLNASQQQGGNRGYISIIILIAFVAIIYFIMIRPQRKKDKEIREMRNSVQVGTKIVTIGGIYGTIVKVTDDRIVITVGSDRVKMEFAKWAISSVITDKEATASKSAAKPAPEEETEDVKKVGKPAKMLKKKTAENAEEAAEETATEE